MTHNPERPINPPDPPISLEAEYEAIATDRIELGALLSADPDFCWALAELYQRGCRDALLYSGLIDEAIRAEAERRVEEHLK